MYFVWHAKCCRGHRLWPMLNFRIMSQREREQNPSPSPGRALRNPPPTATPRDRPIVFFFFLGCLMPLYCRQISANNAYNNKAENAWRKQKIEYARNKAKGNRQKTKTTNSKKKNTGKTQRGQKRKSYRLSNNGKHLFQGGEGGGLGVSVEKRFHFAEHPVIE